MEDIVGKIEKLVDEIIKDSAIFLLEVLVKPNHVIKVFIDSDDGIDIDAISKISKVLQKQLNESGWFPDGDFSLEVGSPGVGTPLKHYRQYPKNIGRLVRIKMLDGTECKGIMEVVNEHEIVVKSVSSKNKKTQPVEKVIPFDQIQSTRVELEF